MVSSGGLICTIVQNFVKIGQTIYQILQFFDFQDGRHPPSWILQFLKILVSHQVGRAKTHHPTKFVKIGRTAAEILHLTFFIIAAVRHLEFVKN